MKPKNNHPKNNHPKNNYQDAGVDIEKGERFVDYIKSMTSSAVSSDIGGFAGGVPIDTAGYKNPVLFSTTDGVGTKLLVARTLNNYTTIGIDLVAMCANDLLVCNVMPVSFLDYIACESIDEEILAQVMQGIVKGCEQAGCELSGGETAELPDLYHDGAFDLAGFCVGIGDGDTLLPRTNEIAPGDVLMGLPSTGIHSNGLSLARKLISAEDGAIYEELLTPTKIYRRELEVLLATGAVSGAAHITGGGIINNIKRVLPHTVSSQLNYSWPVPDIFTEIRKRGEVSEEEMYKVFNMGIGICCVVKREEEKTVVQACAKHSVEIHKIGEIISG